MVVGTKGNHGIPGLLERDVWVYIDQLRCEGFATWQLAVGYDYIKVNIVFNGNVCTITSVKFSKLWGNI